jgi:hypothetical protein
MMLQAWFEMAEIRHRKFAPSAWIPLRSVQPANCASAAMTIATLLERLTKSEIDKRGKHG